jgi:hypothetical protein
MTQPKVPKAKMPFTSKLQMPLPLVQTSLNAEIFEQQIRGQGVRICHKRPVPCPKIRDINAGDHNPACNLCNNGFIFYGETFFIGAFAGNELIRMFNINNTWDIDSAAIITPVKDEKGQILDVQYFDQLILPDFTVRYYQRVEFNQSGVDVLHFQPVSVDFVIDENGVRYQEGVNFDIRDGRIIWRVNRDVPGFDATLDRGTIYSVNYYTRPHFTVTGLPHQLRITQTRDEEDEKNTQARFPQLCVVRKDFIPFKPQDKIGPNDRPEPARGGFGPRTPLSTVDDSKS